MNTRNQDIFPAITSCNVGGRNNVSSGEPAAALLCVDKEIIFSKGEQAAALLCVGTFKNLIGRWELGQKSAVSAVFTVLSSAMFTY